MNIYVELANHIDKVYDSWMWNHTPDHAFVKIFQTLLTEKEAFLALHMTNTYTTSEALANIVKQTKENVEELLESLVTKGIIFVQRINELSIYRLLPYMPGIVEAMLSGTISEEIAEYIDQYMNELEQYKQSLQTYKIPMNYKVETKIYHISIEELYLYLDRTTSYSVADCICRQVNEKNGRACGHPIKDRCIQTGNYAEYYIATGRGRRISREEVEEILQQAEKEGLYHEIYPVDDTKENAFICNCCSCGCLFMRLSGRIHQVMMTEVKMEVLPERCNGCGECIRECPEQAFRREENGRKVIFDSDTCFQCGLCKLVCRQGAIIDK